MYFVYVLYSSDYDKIYVGYSSDLKARLEAHNDDRNKGWTSKYRPWVVIYYETFSTKKSALIREKQLKSYKGREFIRTMIVK